LPWISSSGNELGQLVGKILEAEKYIFVVDLRLWGLDKSETNKGLHAGWLRRTTVKASPFKLCS
jgi:hypothetical protein